MTETDFRTEWLRLMERQTVAAEKQAAALEGMLVLYAAKPPAWVQTAEDVKAAVAARKVKS